jgi:hypothetical protein
VTAAALSELLAALLAEEGSGASAGADRPTLDNVCPGNPSLPGQCRDAESKAGCGVPAVPAVPAEKSKVEGVCSGKAVQPGAGGAGMDGKSSARGPGRDQLRRAAEAAGLDPARVLALDDAEPGDLDGLTPPELAGYALALVETAERMAGRVPAGWSQRSECAGCGPVWLGAGSPSYVLACPWCLNRKAGLRAARPAVRRGAARTGDTGAEIRRDRRQCPGVPDDWAMSVPRATH